MTTSRIAVFTALITSLSSAACGTDHREAPGEDGHPALDPYIPLVVVEDKTPRKFGGTVDVPDHLPDAVHPSLGEFSEHLSSLIGTRMSLTETEDRYLLTSAEYSGFITKKRNHFSIERNEVDKSPSGVTLERIASAERPSVRHPNEDSMMESARRLTGLLGASDSEMSDAVYRKVGASSGSGDAHVVAQKIFVFRRIAGLEVPSDRSVVTYDLEGRFTDMRGTWTPYTNQGAAINLGTGRSAEEFVELARQRAYQMVPESAKVDELPQASVIFELREIPDGYEAAVKGLVAVPVSGPRGQLRFTFQPFDL